VPSPRSARSDRSETMPKGSLPDAHLFDRAFAAEQLGDLAEAERLYRLLMKSDPTDASAPFNLGNMLRTAGRMVEAEAALGNAL
jgi:Flp pilus assembly protein TadD